jgi:pimeloyl-ACP methyl ester carboxylesterase
MRSTFAMLVVSATVLGSALGAQEHADTSPHQTKLIAVENNVQLEVLDWGGSGRPVVLLAGLGATAHSFDNFAPKLAANYHVYAITRRGFGRSSTPATGYDADRLGDDVLAVIDSLRLRRPVLAGHSIAGEELSSIGSRHPEKVSGLVYLDAGYDYAFYDPENGNVTIAVNEIIRQLDKLRAGSGASPAERRMAMVTLADTSLPAYVRWLHAVLKEAAPPPPGPPPLPMARVPYAIISGERKYTVIHGPVLAICATTRPLPPGAEKDTVMMAMVADADAGAARQVNAFARGVPQARVVRIPRADHFIWRSHEADVLREMRAFIDSLPRTPGRSAISGSPQRNGTPPLSMS